MIARKYGAPLLVAVTVFLLCAPDALGMFWMKDFREMVQQADRVIKGKVIRGADVLKPEPQVALIKVLKHFKPGGEERLEVYIEGSSCNPERYAFREGEVCFLCLICLRDRPEAYQEINYGHTKIPVSDGRVSLGKAKVHDSLKFLLPDRKIDSFENALRWIAGPEITMKPVAESYLCDKDILFDVKLKNGSRTPMKIPVGKGLALGCHFDLSLVGKHGFYTAVSIYGGHDKGNESFPDKEMSIVAELQPGKSLEGRIRFRVPLDRYFQDPENTRFGEVEYRPRERGALQQQQWFGSTSVTVPLRIACPYRKWAQTLMRPNRTTSIQLETQEVLSPERSLWVRVEVNRSKAGEVHGGYGVHSFHEKRDKNVLAALVRCFEISRGEKVVQKNGGDSEAVRKFIESNWNLTFTVDLSEHFDFSRPGEYRLRLYLPGPDGFSVSQQVRLLVPGREK